MTDNMMTFVKDGTISYFDKRLNKHCSAIAWVHFTKYNGKSSARMTRDEAYNYAVSMGAFPVFT